MTSLTYNTHMFVLVFLNSIHLSKEGCQDYLDADNWKDNLTDTFTLKTTKDPKDILNCTLEAACHEGKDAACKLLSICFFREAEKKKSPECEGESSQEIHFFHFMCLMAKRFEVVSNACEYDTVCKMYPKTRSIHDDQTTQSTTTTTILAETAKTASLSSPTKAAITTLEPTTTPPEKTTSSTNLDRLHKGKEPDPPNDTTADNLKYILGLSLLFNVSLPMAVYLYMRHRLRTLTPFSNGNLTSNQAKTESDTQPASTDQDAGKDRLSDSDLSDTQPASTDQDAGKELLTKVIDKYSDDYIPISFNTEEQTNNVYS